LKYNTIIVGAGIVGLAVAREVARRRPDSRIAVIEKTDGVASHQTGHNSGVIHGGIYYEPGSLKARLCVEGARLLYEYCDEHAIPYDRCGKLIVAVREEQLGRLDELERRGRVNMVPHLRRLSAEEIKELEPNATGLQALHAPNTGIVDYGRVSQAIADELRGWGVDFHFGCLVERIDERGSEAVVVHKDGEFVADQVISCAGLWSDRLARQSGAPADPRIVPFRGAYLGLKPREEPLIRRMIYPVPDPDLPFLGVHVTPSMSGRTMLGPTAMVALSREGYKLSRINPRDAWDIATWPGAWKVGQRFWRTAIEELRFAMSRRAFVEACAEYVPSLTVNDLDGTATAGVRAQAVSRGGKLVDDFVIARIGPVLHVRNAPSPAATSAFALAREIVEKAEVAA